MPGALRMLHRHAHASSVLGAVAHLSHQVVAASCSAAPSIGGCGEGLLGNVRWHNAERAVECSLILFVDSRSFFIVVQRGTKMLL